MKSQAIGECTQNSLSVFADKFYLLLLVNQTHENNNEI